MADKILVNYEGNVQPLVDALKRVEAEQAKVDASAKKTSDDIGKGATDAGKKVEGLGNEIKKTGTEAEETGKKAKKAFDETNSTAGTLNKTVAKLGVAIAGAFALDRIIAFGKEAAELARKASGVERAFERLNNPQLLGQLQKATKGLVSDLNLMTAAVRAKNFQIPLEQLPKLFEFAQRRAQETGESVDYLVESIILGIGRKSPMILDNLGISAVRLREGFKGVAVEAASVGDVARVVGGIVSEELAGMGENVDILGDAAARAGVKWDNLKTKVGQSLLAVGDAVASLFLDKTQETEDNADAYVKSISKVDDSVNTLVNSFKSLDIEGKSNTDLFGMLAEATGKLQQEEIRLEAALKETEKLWKGHGKAANQANADHSRLKRELEFVRQGYAALDQVAAGWVATQEQAKQKSAAPTLESLKKTVTNLKTELDKLEIGSDDYNTTLGLLKTATADLKAEEDKLKDSTVDGTSAIDKRIAALKDLHKLEAVEDDSGPPDTERINNEIKALDALLKKYKEVTQQELDNIKTAKERDDQSFQDNLDRLEREEQAREQAEANKQAAIQATFDLAVSLGNALAQIQNNALERDAMAIQARSNAELEAIDKELSAKNISEKRKEELIKQRDALEEQSAQQLAEIRKKQAINDKAAALFEIAINTAQAITKFLAAGQPVLAAFAAAQGIIQGAVVASQPIPEFAKGVVDLQGPGTGTSDSIPAKLSKGESVIQAANTKKYRSAVEAIHGDYFDKYVTQNHVLPALREYDRVMNEKKGKDLASNLAASLNLQNIFKDGNIVYELKRGRWNGEANTDKIVRAIKKSRVKTRPGKS